MNSLIIVCLFYYQSHNGTKIQHVLQESYRIIPPIGNMASHSPETAWNSECASVQQLRRFPDLNFDNRCYVTYSIQPLPINFQMPYN